MKKLLLIIGGSILFFAIIGVCNKSEKESTPEAKGAVSEYEAAIKATRDSLGIKEEVIPVNENWEYSSAVDEMDNSKTKFAEACSENQLDFKFPYAGGSYGYLGIRKNKNGTDFYLKISKGQFIGSYSGEKTLRVKFDNEKAYEISYGSPTDGSSDFIFINASNSFLNKLKTHKKIKVEVDFYQYSGSVLNFDIEGLKW